MVDFDTLALGSIYTIFGKSVDVVTVKGDAHTLRIQDLTAGVQIGFAGSKGHVIDGAGDFSIAQLRPAAAVRVSELSTKSIAAADLEDGTITIKGRAWRIKTHAPKPSDGADSGEIYLILEASDI